MARKTITPERAPPEDVDRVEAARDRLWAEFEEFCATCADAQDIMAGFSLNGDSDATRHMAHSIANDSMDGKALNPVQKNWLIEIMYRIVDSADVTATISRGPRAETRRRGAPNSPWKAFNCAVDVADEIIERGATSIEDARAAAAESWAVDDSTVKRYWRDHKLAVFELIAKYHKLLPELRPTGRTRLEFV